MLIQRIYLARQVSPSSLFHVHPSASCALSSRGWTFPIKDDCYSVNGIPIAVLPCCIFQTNSQIGAASLQDGSKPLSWFCAVPSHIIARLLYVTFLSQIIKNNVASALLSLELLDLGETNCHVVKIFKSLWRGPHSRNWGLVLKAMWVATLKVYPLTQPSEASDICTPADIRTTTSWETEPEPLS